MRLNAHSIRVPDTADQLLNEQERHALALLLTEKAGTSNQRGGIRRILKSIRFNDTPVVPDYQPAALTNRVTARFKADMKLLELTHAERIDGISGGLLPLELI